MVAHPISRLTTCTLTKTPWHLKRLGVFYITASNLLVDEECSTINNKNELPFIRNCLFFSNPYIIHKYSKKMSESQGERIRRAREEKGLKQGHVAREAKITQAHLSRIENDESGVTDHTLKKIAEVVGESLENLVVRKDSGKGPGVMSIDDVLSSESAMVRFLNGERPDKDTYDWVRRSLAVIRAEVRRRNDDLKGLY